MINLEEYKNILISTYKYEFDNTEEQKRKRKKYLEKYYSDEYLSKIINNTYTIIKRIFDINEHGFCYIKIEDDMIHTISLNLVGGYHSDRLYIDINGNIISEYILKRTFGTRLSIDVNIEEHDIESDDPDIISFDYEYFLYMQGFPNNMREIKENLFGSSKVLSKI